MSILASGVMQEAYVEMGTEAVRVVQATSNPFFDEVAPVLSLLGEGTAILIAAVLVTIFYGRARWLGAAMVAAFLLSSFLNVGLKEAIEMPRPSRDDVHNFGVAEGYATPSAHSMIAAASWFLLALILQRGWWTWCLVAIPLLVGVTRIYMGFHYPADVLLGLLCGGVIALAIQRLLDRPEGTRFSLATSSPCIVLLLSVALLDAVQ